MYFFKAKKGVMELDNYNSWHVWTHNSCPWLQRREIMQFKFQESWIVFFIGFVACITNVNITCPCFAKLSN